MNVTNCKTCGKEIDAGSFHKKYCSDECRPWINYKLPVLTKNCKNCNAEFTTSRPLRVFCSARCQATFSNHHGPKKPWEPGERYCKKCNKVFIPVTYNNLFCSPECNNPDLNSNRIKKCQQCGIEYEFQSSSQKFCSTNCKSKWHHAHETYALKTFEPIPCLHCGKMFNRKRSTKVFCSGKCNLVYSSKNGRISQEEAGIPIKSRSLVKILAALDEDAFCRKATINIWRKSSEVEKHIIEALNTDIDFTKV